MQSCWAECYQMQIKYIQARRDDYQYTSARLYNPQRWSPRGRPWPRGHILKSLALASKVKFLALASRPQVLENWPVLGSRTALFFESLKFCGALAFFCGDR